MSLLIKFISKTRINETGNQKKEIRNVKSKIGRLEFEIFLRFKVRTRILATSCEIVNVKWVT